MIWSQIEFSDYFLRWPPKPAGWRYLRVNLTNISGNVTHNVKFWLRFLVSKFTAVYFPQGMSIVIFSFKIEERIYSIKKKFKSVNKEEAIKSKI